MLTQVAVLRHSRQITAGADMKHALSIYEWLCFSQTDEARFKKNKTPLVIDVWKPYNGIMQTNL